MAEEKSKSGGSFSKLPTRAKRAAFAKMSAKGKLRTKNKSGVRSAKPSFGRKKEEKTLASYKRLVDRYDSGDKSSTFLLARNMGFDAQGRIRSARATKRLTGAWPSDYKETRKKLRDAKIAIELINQYSKTPLSSSDRSLLGTMKPKGRRK